MTKEVKSIGADITTLSTKLADKITIDDEGLLTETEVLFDATHSEDDVNTVKRAQQLTSTFNTALLHAASGKALPVMKEKGIKRVSGAFKVGDETTSINITAPTGRKADGSMKDPVVTVISRRVEHADHGAVRQAIYDQYRTLAD